MVGRYQKQEHKNRITNLYKTLDLSHTVGNTVELALSQSVK